MPKNNLRVAVVPIEILPGRKAENLATVERELSRLKGEVDLVVLPELFTTGFVSDPDLLENESETSTGPTVQQLHRWAERGGYAICGSFLAKTGAGMYNRAFFIEPSGDELFYDKRHLFTMGKEDQILRPGQTSTIPIVRFRGWNIAMSICYDLRFPVWLRNDKLAYDALVIPANWPESRSHAWLTLLNARAIENQAYVVGTNRLGGEGKDHYPHALTRIYDYSGRMVGVSDDDPTILYATFDAEGLNTWREKFPAWRDADRFQLL